MNHSIYPIGGAERELPFYIYGIGFNDWQYDAIRKDGYICHQIIYCIEGKGRLIINNKEYIITPGMGFYLPANFPHEYYTVGDLWETHWIAFDGYESLQTMDKLGFASAKVFNLPVMDNLEEIFQKSYLTLNSDRFYGVFSTSGYLYSFLLELHRLVYQYYDESEVQKNSALIAVLNYIDAHFSDDIELDKLCEIANITPQHLCRIFKKRLEMRPLEYIARKRMQTAKNLLFTTNKTIKEVAEAVGYRDTSYFGLIFRKYEKISPSEFRNKCTG